MRTGTLACKEDYCSLLYFSPVGVGILPDVEAGIFGGIFTAYHRIARLAEL